MLACLRLYLIEFLEELFAAEEMIFDLKYVCWLMNCCYKYKKHRFHQSYHLDVLILLGTGCRCKKEFVQEY